MENDSTVIYSVGHPDTKLPSYQYTDYNIENRMASWPNVCVQHLPSVSSYTVPMTFCSHEVPPSFLYLGSVITFDGHTPILKHHPQQQIMGTNAEM